MKFEVIIPAKDEAETIEEIVACLQDWPEVSAIRVIDNASEDGTGRLAEATGALVLEEPRVGKGYAVKRGLAEARSEHVFVCDADIRGLTRDRVLEAVERVASGSAQLCRLAMSRPVEAAPVTTLVALPSLRHLFPDLKVREPLGGLFAIKREEALAYSLSDDWGFDVALTLSVYLSGKKIEEISAPEITHRVRAITEYEKMACEVTRTILHFADRLLALGRP
jgi:glycosyltransferase involved in cell wall biosynthesis